MFLIYGNPLIGGWIEKMIEKQNPVQDQLNLAACVVHKLAAGEPYTRETFRACYFETLPEGTTESVKISEMWIDVLWGRLKTVSPSKLVTAYRSKIRFTDLIYEVWGKAV